MEAIEAQAASAHGVTINLAQQLVCIFDYFKIMSCCHLLLPASTPRTICFYAWDFSSSV